MEFRELHTFTRAIDEIASADLTECEKTELSGIINDIKKGFK